MSLVTLAILQISVFFTTIYLHRALTHRGLELHSVVGFLMHLELSLFTGIVPREWVAVHRKHHHFSDEKDDPHSPIQRGLWTVLFGNVFLYRTAKSDPAILKKYTPDWKNDVIDRLPFRGFSVLGGLAIFCLMFGWKWGAAAWLTHVAFYILLNSMINSLGHVVGYRNYENKATNLQWVAFLTGGEGLHNNHHQHPSSARFSMNSWELDPAWPVIRLLESCGLAKVSPLPIAKAA
ncbi:MAG: fatty acid desaturase [Acidobacteria bacterium]|nr:fatty acid desaturase [Acidobacteriota bacterium]